MSEEEKLAREALQKIRVWLEKEKEAGGGGSTPRLAIKFCGGCNPVIERGEVARKIREELAGARWVSWEEESDLLVVINGCPTACAEREEISARIRKPAWSFILEAFPILKRRIAHRA